jgi:hypothetical protein
MLVYGFIYFVGSPGGESILWKLQRLMANLPENAQIFTHNTTNIKITRL